MMRLVFFQTEWKYWNSQVTEGEIFFIFIHRTAVVQWWYLSWWQMSVLTNLTEGQVFNLAWSDWHKNSMSNCQFDFAISDYYLIHVLRLISSLKLSNKCFILTIIDTEKVCQIWREVRKVYFRLDIDFKANDSQLIFMFQNRK